ncbi:TPA: ABC transporter ATP-binding protein [Burkholderia multivorans]|uniref:ABC transporter ATP-binding protein n=1 Tax=Burkholderia multivorans TaxID=87883 RepID=UPI001C237CE5|nr:ABC transporter ATP-binding protein [Burkholderia multivorans]MBU9349152.1 ABC transporter ATP-binding protein/permease [Burkholderia multivorans]HDR9833754.1 ABC transporter ATP-binding protein [Burkholderia multivorans]HDR9840499.1 ABC transporter ATP-binding protein [Burkholderia multivorans]HDR9846215.1 ABC transporter ATP-binding protein [Burkholderia multivorans]HDR9852465.1 ABC transporter ATP-binding protein [Burkholderia multivorans]
MFANFVRLLGDDAPVFRRYAWKSVFLRILNGLTLVALAPLLGHLLAGDLRAAWIWLVVLGMGLVIGWAWRRQVEHASVQVRIAVLRGCRHRIGDHIARLPVGWFTAQNTTRLGHMLTHGMFELSELPGHLFTPIVSGLVTPLVLVVALFAMYWPLGLITLLALPILVGVFLLSARLGQQADDVFHGNAASTGQRIIEFAQAQSVLRAFSGSNGGARYLEEAIDRQHQAGKRLIAVSTASVVLNAWTVQAVFAALLVAATWWLNGHLGMAQHTDAVIAVIVSLLLVCRFIDPLLDVAGYGEVLRSARGQLDAVVEVLDEKPMPEPVNPQVPKDDSVEMRDVGFRYAPGAPGVLKRVNMRIEPGSMVALVGASGSGKTTVVRLIARFFDVSEGSVLIGGVDVRNIAGAQLAAQISQIFQSSYLFQGSIADNIRIGKPDATDDEVREAARQAGVTEIVERLPQGLDTPVGEGGVRLSGGERQRISIARALIKNAPILLVDEATAALDAENQAAVAETLARLRGQRTLIVIAHQLSTVAMSDQIVVLDEGSVVETGTHDQLVARQGRYARFLAQRRAAKAWQMA